jgi:deazaflavin-dependent oxidoreductase (nitroreductase family)
LLLAHDSPRSSGESGEQAQSVVALHGGQANHLAWWWNLLADPKAWVTMGGKEIAVVATQLTGAEHDRTFLKFADYGTNYDAYRGRTDRELRVFELTGR